MHNALGWVFLNHDGQFVAKTKKGPHVGGAKITKKGLVVVFLVLPLVGAKENDGRTWRNRTVVGGGRGHDTSLYGCRGGWWVGQWAEIQTILNEHDRVAFQDLAGGRFPHGLPLLVCNSALSGCNFWMGSRVVSWFSQYPDFHQPSLGPCQQPITPKHRRR